MQYAAKINIGIRQVCAACANANPKAIIALIR